MLDSPFLYLSACSIKNRLLSQVRRVRQPRYLIGAIVGLAYLGFIFLRQSSVSVGRSESRRRVSAMRSGIPVQILGALQLAAAFVLWLVVAARWIIPVSIQPLKLSGPERDILLGAPITRRRITRYKLLRSQLAVFFSTVLMLFIARRSVSDPWSVLFGMFLLFVTARMHLLGVALARRMGRPRGARHDLPTAAALVVVLLGTAGALLSLAPGAVVLAQTQDPGAALRVVSDVASRPPAAIALLPFTVMVRPVFAAWPLGFLAAVLPAVGLALLNFAWVVRTEDLCERSSASTEREAIEGTRPPSRVVHRVATGEPFVLRTRGRPEWALVWKNLIMLGRYASPSTLLRVGLALALLSLVVAGSHRREFATVAVTLTAAVCCGIALLGAYSVRNDLRQDLAQLAVLKTWPISGEQLLWGEVLAPSIVLTAVAWVGILVTGIFALAVPATVFGWGARVAVGLSAAILFPALILAQVVVQNAAAVLFPGWVSIGPSRPRGVEVLGQQMLMFGGSMLLFALGVLPGVAVATIIAVVTYPLIGWAAIPPAAMLVAVLIAGEVALAVHVLSAVLDRTDPTDVGPTP